MKISIILPFFGGSLPNYFDLWLASAKRNGDFDFYLFVDKDIQYEIPRNVHVIRMNFSEAQRRIRQAFGRYCSIDTPYKLCDYKPSYGIVFSDYLKDAEWWGYCDPDIIWGNLSKFITKEMFENNDRILLLGHLSLYKNTNENNSRFLLNGDIPYTAKEAMLIRENVFFDEVGCRLLAEQGEYKYIDFRNQILDIWPVKYRFCSFFTRGKETNFIAEYNNGKVYAIYEEMGKVIKREFAYIHLQKRKMKISISDASHFLILPNEFVDYDEKFLIPERIVEVNERSEINYVCPEKKFTISIRKMYVEIRRHIRRLFVRCAKKYYTKINTN